MHNELPTWALVLAGGRGTRFWPLSRKSLPKQCLSIDGGPTLIQQTVNRLLPMIPLERILILTGPDMAAPIREQLPDLPLENMLIEPSGRNTGPCIVWGTWEATRRGAQAVVVLPSDHVIQDEPEFRRVLGVALAEAQLKALLTLGVRPTRAETGFGWIEPEEDGQDTGGPSVRVRRFLEKPPQARADALLAEGKCLWNAGMFVWEGATLLEEVGRFLPGASRMILGLDAGKSIGEVWGEAEATSIDYGILERSDRVRTIPVAFGWSDVGSWPALAEVLAAHPWGVGPTGGVVDIRASGNILHAPGKMVALLGVRDLVVVETEDVLMVASKAEAQAVRGLIDALEAQGLKQYL